MNDEKTVNARDMIANYVALARKAARYWPRAFIVFAMVLGAGMAYVVRRPRVYKSEASAAIHDVSPENAQPQGAEEAAAELHARLDQIYGSRANLGRVVDELHLYPWMQGRTSRMKIIEGFQDALTYAPAGRDGLHLEFLYKDPSTAQRTVARLLRLYTEERRTAGQMQSRNDLASVDTALAGLEAVLSTQEERLERFEHANHDMVEQVRLRRMGQMQARAGLVPGAMLPPAIGPVSNPDDSSPTRRLRIRLAALQGRQAALERAMAAPTAPAAAVTAPAPVVEESEHVQTLRHTVADLRDRLARLRTTYTDQYPDVAITMQRLADAERELQTAVTAERPHAHAPVVAAGSDPAQMRTEIDSVAREIESTRAALSTAIRDDRAHPVPVAPAPVAPAPVVAAVVAAAPSVPGPDDTAAGGHSIDGQLSNLVEVESAWDRLTSELSTTRTRYQTLLSHKFELQAQLDTVNTTGADVLRVIDPPTLPAEPEPPGRTKLAMMAFALALGLALGVAGLSGYLDGRLYEPADLRRWGELPELPVIPDLAEERLSHASTTGPGRAASAAG